MLKTYQGSCHCGAVRFECDLDLAAPTFRCNCSFCAKARMWKAFALKDGFRLRQGAEVLSTYRARNSSWPEGNIFHYFCNVCGIRSFSKGFLDFAPFNGWFHAINVATLDGVSDAELAHISIQYENGREDIYDAPPAETRHL